MSKTKTPAKKASPKAEATKPAKVQCAKGGAHEWEQEDGGIFCKKCHEAKPAVKGKTAPAAKPTKKTAKPEPSRNGKLSAIDAAVKVLGRIQRADEHPRDDRGDGQEGILDQPWRRNPLGDALFRDLE
jgi:hypothetical protein